MKKILFIHSSSELYGSDRSLLNIIKGLSEKNYELFVSLPEDGVLVGELKKIPKVKVLIYDMAILRRKNLSITGIYRYIKQLKKSVKYFKTIIKENNIDIVYTNTSVTFPGAIAAKKCNVKSIWHIREIIKNKFENLVISLIVNKYSDIVIANSNSTAKAIKIRKSKIKVIYNAIDTFEKENIQKKRDSKLFYVGMAGRINRWKGQSFFVDVAKLCKSDNSIRFLIAGSAYSGEERLESELKDYIKKSGLEGKVELLGQVTDMNSFYNSLDVFVLPSVKPEPFGLVLIEAMRNGIPVIATNHGGPTEIIENGINGFLVSFNNPKEMADKIVELKNNENLRKKMIEEGIKTQKNKYSFKRLIEEINEIIENI